MFVHYMISKKKKMTKNHPKLQGCIQDFCQGGARLFVAAGQPQGGGCRREMCPLPHNIDMILS